MKPPGKMNPENVLVISIASLIIVHKVCNTLIRIFEKRN